MAAIPGAIVGVWGPDGDYVKAFGVADKSTGAPMETDFYHRIGSVTKTFTVTGLLQLVDEDKVALDDPISKYVEGVPAGDQITLRQLARMQSGLPNYTANKDFQQALLSDPMRAFTPQELLGYAFTQPASFPPGQVSSIRTRTRSCWGSSSRRSAEYRSRSTSRRRFSSR